MLQHKDVKQIQHQGDHRPNQGQEDMHSSLLAAQKRAQVPIPAPKMRQMNVAGEKGKERGDPCVS